MSAEIEAAWGVLAEIADPCSEAIGCSLSLVEMRIVKSVAQTGGGMTVTLQLTEPSCVFAFHIAETVTRELSKHFGPRMFVDVRLAHDYPEVWTEDAMLPDAQARLAEFRHRRRLPLRPLSSHPSPTEPEHRS